MGKTRECFAIRHADANLHNFFYRTHGRFPFAAKHRGGNIIPQSFGLYNRTAADAVVFSQFFWPAALQQLTGLLADGTWVR
jgi:hypothetical protein